MNTKTLCSMVIVLTLSGCAIQQDPCEDIRLAKEQLKQCQILQNQINAASGKPILRTELERRYQESCVDIRYYRDEHQNAICGNKEEMKAIESTISDKNR
ncbi:hypothetical protein [Thalassotalea profundi]|uniref:Lipoprotein n=1 Tax=Thalassotalea profundi TaxID=2036687 RepID=A0ABQ3IZQ0_9GAMM|nr:hypothetical protein [Thalassotalea profundi]GHE99317.1 hypothetical protein GCM10011501_31100 [Thalassotalea profundi]